MKIKETLNSLRMKQLIIRFISALSIFTILIFFTLNFNLSSYPKLIIFAFFIVITDYIVATITGIHDIPLYRSIVSLVASAIIIYMAQFFVSGFYISMLSTLIAATIYGLIQFYLPNKV